MPPTPHSRLRGALIGLAAGDALGTTLEFQEPGSFKPITNMVGGGPFRLKPGEWTDDTSMALCLAESLVECHGMDAADQMQRFLRWYRDGHLSSTGTCFDVGGTTRRALRAFEKSGDPWQGGTDPAWIPNGSLMRLAPVPMFFAGDPARAIAAAAESSRTTHAAPIVVDACRYFAALLTGAFAGASKAQLLDDVYGDVLGYWNTQPLAPEIRAIAAGSFRTKQPPEIRGAGSATGALEAALWAFDRTSSFREACLLAVNLGDDADTTGAICGQIAGAYYGEDGIPAAWRAKLARWDVIDRLAEEVVQVGASVRSAVDAS
jgi:ADP-ribosyl-[dinitrogen reductase] hydrolase